MLDSPVYRITEESVVKDLVRRHGWVTLVSLTSSGLVASHLPVVLQEGEGFELVGHLGRPDDEVHELGASEAMIIVQGSHGYVSSSWYGTGPTASTWDFVVAHLYGVPEPVLDPEKNLRLLVELQATYEAAVAEPVLLDQAEGAHALSRGARAFRFRVTRWQGRKKMSQNRPVEVVERIVAHLEDPSDPYANPELAALVREANAGRPR